MIGMCRACMQISDNLSDISAPVRVIVPQNAAEIEEITCMANILDELTRGDVSIRAADDLPQNVCPNCIQRAEDALVFKRMIEISHQNLMSPKKTTKIKVEQKASELIEICDMIEIDDLEPSEDPNIHREEPKAIEKEIKPTTYSCTTRQQTRGTQVKKEIISKNIESMRDYNSPGQEPDGFQCPFCPNTSSTKGNLKVHIRIHTGERPFHCSRCPKTFIQRQNLTIHFRKHTGERPYKCPKCSRRFSQISGMRAHFKRQPWHAVNETNKLKKRKHKQ